MKSPDDETLVLYHYGELDPVIEDRVRRQLEDDAEARERLDELRRSLAAVDESAEPPVDPELPGRVWAAVEGRLPPASRTRGWRSYRPVMVRPRWRRSPSS